MLLAGCDKTTPGTLMGAISAGLPTIFCPAGPMLSDRVVKPGQPAVPVGAGTHTRMFWDEYQAGDRRRAVGPPRVAHDPLARHLQRDGHP